MLAVSSFVIRFLKWSGVCLSLVLAISWTLTTYLRLQFEWTSGDRWLAMYNGAILAEWETLDPPSGWRWSLMSRGGQMCVLWSPETLRIKGGDEDGKLIGILVPIWIAFVVTVLPTAVLFLRSQRENHRGLCVRCNYNLTGLTEPRCPECGTPFDPRLLQNGPAEGGDKSENASPGIEEKRGESL